MISAYGGNTTVATILSRGARKSLTTRVDFPQLRQDVIAVIAETRDPDAL